MAAVPYMIAPDMVRTGDEPVRESQRVLHTRSRSRKAGAHRRRAGAGVSTGCPRRGCPTRRPCAPATSRCGSLNSYLDAAARDSAAVRESQLVLPLIALPIRRGCVPATSRVREHQPEQDVGEGAVSGGAHRRRAGAGVVDGARKLGGSGVREVNGGGWSSRRAPGGRRPRPRCARASG